MVAPNEENPVVSERESEGDDLFWRLVDSQLPHICSFLETRDKVSVSRTNKFLRQKTEAIREKTVNGEGEGSSASSLLADRPVLPTESSGRVKKGISRRSMADSVAHFMGLSSRSITQYDDGTRTADDDSAVTGDVQGKILKTAKDLTTSTLDEGKGKETKGNASARFGFSFASKLNAFALNLTSPAGGKNQAPPYVTSATKGRAEASMLLSTGDPLNSAASEGNRQKTGNNSELDVTAGLSPLQMRKFLELHAHLKRFEEERREARERAEDLEGRLKAKESVRVFLVEKLRSTEIHLASKMEALMQSEAQARSDREVISFLDERSEKATRERDQAKDESERLRRELKGLELEMKYRGVRSGRHDAGSEDEERKRLRREKTILVKAHRKLQKEVRRLKTRLAILESCEDGDSD